jgi:Tol biopolymer transport system component
LDFGLAKLARAVTAVVDNSERHPRDDGDADRLPFEVMPAAGSNPFLSRTGVAMGTAGYMSPEQVRGEKLDARTDLFSFGAVLYEMATGRRAFTGDTGPVLREAILTQVPSPAREVNPELPAKLEKIIGRALEKDREARYQAASEMLSVLETLKREVASKHPVRWREMAAAGVVVLLMIGTIFWFARRRSATPERLATERQITANPPENWVRGGAISPDGKFVAYQDWTGLYVRSVESGETLSVSVPAELMKRMSGLSWSPGGGKLLTAVSGRDGYDIWEITVMGEAEPKLLFRNGWEPAVSPDKRTIAFTRMDRGIWMGGTDGSDPRMIVDAEQDHQYEMYPVWSPDGHWLAYMTYESMHGRSATMVRPAGGGPARTLLADSGLPKPHRLSPEMNRGFAWCGDGRMVFQVADRWPATSSRTNFGLWQVRVDLERGQVISKPSELTKESSYLLWDPTCANNDERLSVVKNKHWDDVYVAELNSDGGTMKSPRFTMDNRGSDIGVWTRDSHAILFASERNGTSHIFQQALDANAAELVATGAGDLSEVDMSADGTWLLYLESDSKSAPGRPSESFWLMRKPTASGAPERVLRLTTADDFHCARKPQVASESVLSHDLDQGDERQIVFYALDPVRGKGDQLAKLQFTPARIRNLWGNRWDLSPDGAHLALLDLDKQGARILVIAVADGSRKQVLLEPGAGRPISISWAADGQGFFLSTAQTTSIDLLHVTMNGEFRTLWRNDHGQPVINPIQSPDGKYLAFKSYSFDSNVWLIDDF